MASGGADVMVSNIDGISYIIGELKPIRLGRTGGIGPSERRWERRNLTP
jgi:hypothetical protein